MFFWFVLGDQIPDCRRDQSDKCRRVKRFTPTILQHHPCNKWRRNRSADSTTCQRQAAREATVFYGHPVCDSTIEVWPSCRLPGSHQKAGRHEIGRASCRERVENQEGGV